MCVTMDTTSCLKKTYPPEILPLTNLFLGLIGLSRHHPPYLKCMWTTKALARLRICTILSEPRLLFNAMSIKCSYAGLGLGQIKKYLC